MKVFVNSPLDLKDTRMMQRFDQMVQDFEAIDKCRGEFFTNYVRSLALDFQRYLSSEKSCA